MARAQELKKNLEILGLGRHEASVYLDLLGRGLTNVGPVVQATKLHRQQVYEALENLRDLGMVTEIERSGRKHFQAAKPRRLMHLVEQKVAIAEDVVPELEALSEVGLDRIEVRTLYGQQEYFDNCLTMVESAAEHETELRVMGGAPESLFYDTLGVKLFERYQRALKKHKVGIKMISPTWYSKEIKDGFARFPGHELRTIEQGLASPTFTRLTPEITSIEIFSPEVMVLSISNRAIARTYLEHWERLWAQAKPYKPSR